MAFTDQQLATRMSELIVQHGVMTRQQRDELLVNPTEVEVRGARLAGATMQAFGLYWNALGNWMASQGGDILATTGTNVRGRTGGNPVGIGNRAIYNDAFRDVNHFMFQDDFNIVKAISNQLRFINVMR